MFWKSDTSKSNSNNKALTPAEKSAALRQQAMANAAAARAAIGDEALERIASAMTRKQQSNMEQAKRKIMDADVDRVVDEILLMLDDHN